MFEIITSSLVLLGAAVYDYKKRRFSSPEDRYMQLYGREEWQSNDMDMYVRFAKEDAHVIKETWCRRIVEVLKDPHSLLHETAIIQPNKGIVFQKNSCTLEDVLKKRQGIYFDLSQEDCIHIVWNHMQLDGVGVWNTIRMLFDENPPLIPYQDVQAPPPFLPEFLSLPQVANQALKRGSLYKEATTDLSLGQSLWDASFIRRWKTEWNIPFNLLTSAMVAKGIFIRHPHVQKLNLGLTVFFPFLKGRNRYGVIIVSVQRGTVREMAQQLSKKIPNPLVMWGNTATQAYAMERVPEAMFLRLMKYYRKQIDVLISNVPVGTNPISVGNSPIGLYCHTRGLSLPYYFLLMGTRADVHCSYSSLFSQEENFFHEPERFCD